MERLGVPLDAEAYRVYASTAAATGIRTARSSTPGQRILGVDPANAVFDVIDELATPGCGRLGVRRRRSSVQLGPAAADAQVQLVGVG